MGILQGFDSVFGRKFSHNQCQLTVGCHMDGSWINALNVFRGAGTASVHFHNEFDVLHTLISLVEKFSETNRSAVHFFEVEYTTAVKGLPHSKQFAFNRDVISPQFGHIRCDP
jgi:hypothetical protein